MFSHPTIGYVGLSEESAVKKYGEDNVVVYKSKFTNMHYAFEPLENKHFTMFKLICLKNENERIIGCHSLGKGIDEMTQIIGVAMGMGATKQDFDNTIAIHPTASEEIVLMNAKLIK